MIEPFTKSNKNKAVVQNWQSQLKYEKKSELFLTVQGKHKNEKRTYANIMSSSLK